MRRKHYEQLKISYFIQVYVPIILSFISVCISLYSLYNTVIISNKEDVKIIEANCDANMIYRKDKGFEREITLAISNNSDQNVSIVAGNIEVNGDYHNYFSTSKNELNLPLNLPSNTTITLNILFYHHISEKDNVILQNKLNDGAIYDGEYINEFFEKNADSKFRAFCLLGTSVEIQLVTSKRTELYYKFFTG